MVLQMNIFIIFNLVKTSLIICKIRGCLKIIIFAHSLYFGFLMILENFTFCFQKCFRAPKFNKMIKLAFFFKLGVTNFKNKNRNFLSFHSVQNTRADRVGGLGIASIGDFKQIAEVITRRFLSTSSCVYISLCDCISVYIHIYLYMLICDCAVRENRGDGRQVDWRLKEEADGAFFAGEGGGVWWRCYGFQFQLWLQVGQVVVAAVVAAQREMMEASSCRAIWWWLSMCISMCVYMSILMLVVIVLADFVGFESCVLLGLS